jgi:hypothetical protein
MARSLASAFDLPTTTTPILSGFRYWQPQYDSQPRLVPSATYGILYSRQTFRAAVRPAPVWIYPEPPYSEWPRLNLQCQVTAPLQVVSGRNIVHYPIEVPSACSCVDRDAAMFHHLVGFDGLVTACRTIIEKLTDAFRSVFKIIWRATSDHHIHRIRSLEPSARTWLRRKAAVPRAVAKWCMRQAILTALGFWNSSFHKATLSISDAAKQIVYGCERAGSLVGASST